KHQELTELLFLLLHQLKHPDNVPVMKSIKRSIDVNNIMNPGKIFDLN
ncbi:hypothetical protein IDG96_01430, partial [Pelagibacterales bacterium SAG-MED16]|nr:hypothetical protein [Pelagibacterales bacterium SAG-MED16]